MKIKKTCVVLIIVGSIGLLNLYSQSINYIEEQNKVINIKSKKSDSVEHSSIKRLRYFRRQCSNNLVSLRLFEEYGSLFSAIRNVALPDECFFKNESEVQRFQKSTSSQVKSIDGVKIELQSEAFKAFLNARTEAKKFGLRISPKAGDSSRRSYAETVKFWKDRVKKGLTYWVKKNKITKKQSKWIRSLSLKKQVLEILKLEKQGIYFGTTKKRTILQSVAAPGGSQHNFMLALDIKQNSNLKIRKILAKHGWYQTVKYDSPHFTYLGLKENELRKVGLKSIKIFDRKYWVVSNNYKTTTKTTNTKKSYISLPNSKIHVTASRGVIILNSSHTLLQILSKKYFSKTRRKLHITSGYRTPERQAEAMYYNLRTYGIRYVAGTYGGRSVAWQIIRAYQKHPNDKAKAIRAMVKVIKSQLKRGKVISPHISGKGFDIRSRGKKAANLKILRSVVSSMKGKVVVEKDHYHVQF